VCGKAGLERYFGCRRFKQKIDIETEIPEDADSGMLDLREKVLEFLAKRP